MDWYGDEKICQFFNFLKIVWFLAENPKVCFILGGHILIQNPVFCSQFVKFGLLFQTDIVILMLIYFYDFLSYTKCIDQQK